MASTDPDARTRLSTKKRVLIALGALVAWIVGAVVLLGVGAIWFFWTIQKGWDAQEVDYVAEPLLDERTAFEAKAAYIVGLAQSNPTAVAVIWGHQVCFIDEARNETCRDASPVEIDVNDQTTRSGVTVWQAKDDGRVFFWFTEQYCSLMFDPQARDARHFAKEHGFRWGRDLHDGWSVLCEIEDDDERHEMWVFDVY